MYEVNEYISEGFALRVAFNTPLVTESANGLPNNPTVPIINCVVDRAAKLPAEGLVFESADNIVSRDSDIFAPPPNSLSDNKASLTCPGDGFAGRLG